MKNPLVISGWSCGHALGAAAIVAGLRRPCDVVCLSQRRLPEYLEALERSGDGLPERILIAGLSVLENPDRLGRAALGLKTLGVRIQWLGAYPIPEPVATNLPFEIQVGPGHTLTETALEQFGTGLPASLLKRFRQLDAVPAKQLSKTDRDWLSLLIAGASQYRRFQLAQILPEIIQKLARGGTIGSEDQRLIDEHRRFGSRELQGRSPAVKKLWDLTRRLGRESQCRVLVTGESGTGKETVAYLIHGHSERASEPFVAFNCADISPQLLGSRLFGHEAGAFTGARERHLGIFEQANHGTLFLDEVGDLSLEIQAGLLRVLQENRFQRLGGTEEIEVDVRVVAATNRDLLEMVRKREFREDLFFRLNVFPVHVPPLRERKEDIFPIAQSFFYGRGQSGFLTPELVQALEAHDWPGNVRELLNVLERCLILDKAECLPAIVEHCRFMQGLHEHRQEPEVPVVKAARPGTGEGQRARKNPEGESLEAALLRHVAAVYRASDNNKSQACRILGVSKNTLKAYLEKAGIRDW